MSAEVLDQLRERAAWSRRRDVIVTADEVAEWPAGALDALVKDGALKGIQPATSVECDGCLEGHVEPVEWVEEPPGSPLRAYVACPEAGRVRVDPKRLRRWRYSEAPDDGSREVVRRETCACGVRHSEDFRWILAGRQEFSLTPRQAGVVGILHEALLAGKPEMSWGQIACMLEDAPDSMSQVFKDQPNWKKLVLGSRRGLYRLNTPS